MLKGFELLFSENQIQTRTRALGREICDHFNSKEFWAIGLMDGAMLFMADLVRHLPLTCRLGTLKAKSYQGQTQNETVTITGQLKIQGCEVLLIEDIVDSGLTLVKVSEWLKAQGASKVWICSLLRKQRAENAAVQVDFTGFEIKDDWVVGYGLDLNGQYRNLRDIFRKQVD